MALVTSLPVSAAVTAAMATFFAPVGRLPNPGKDLVTPLAAVERVAPTNASNGFCPVAPAVTKAVAPFTIASFTKVGNSAF